MKLLYVTERVPSRDPEWGDGSSMIPFEVIRALPSSVETTLLSFGTDTEVPAEIRQLLARVELLRLRPHHLAGALSLLRRADVGTLERNTTAAVRFARRLSDAADVTLVHGPELGFLCRRLKGPVVWQTVDPQSSRLGMAGEFSDGVRSRFQQRKAEQALRLERRVPATTRLLTVGGRDARRWSEQLDRPIRAVPNGVSATPTTPSRSGPPTLCYVGSLDHDPNIDGAIRLVTEILPLLRATLPDLRILLAGRRPTEAILALTGPGVEVLADVPSMDTVFARSDIAVFPDLHGLGIRNGVGEALAAGLPVVATPAAAREQPRHPSLSVAAGSVQIAAQTLEMLRATAGGTGARVAYQPRSWQEAVSEYLEEIDQAMTQAGRPVAAMQSRRHQPG